MSWFIFAISAPVLWAVINHIDKYVISKYSEHRRPASLVVFSGLSSGLACLLIFLFAPIENVSTIQALWGILAGMLFVAGYIPYMQALKEDDVSITASLWQMIAPISYFLGAIFLHEYLSGSQIFAGLLVIIGAVLLTTDFKKFIWKKRVFLLMALGSLMLALNTVIFKVIGLESSFWTISLWEYLGAFIFSLILLSFSGLRGDFISFVKEGGRNIVGLNIFAESLNIVARLLSNFAALLAPIALVYAVNGVQPVFILLYSILLSIFFPTINKESFERRLLVQKVIGILIIVLGAIFLVDF